MKKILSYPLLFSVLLVMASCQKKTPKPAHLRAISMVQYTSAELTVKGKGKNEGTEQTFSLSYAEPTNYQTFTPGYYEITLNVQGNKLLNGTYALGKNGYYTLLSIGLLPDKWKPNPRSTLYDLKYIFAGEELKSTNQYLPQWFMLRDNYDGNKKSAYIRLVNANPRTGTIGVKKGKKSLKSGLAYPMETSMMKTKPGTQRLHIYYGKVQLGEKEIRTKPGYIYTAFIGSKENAMDSLTVSVLENPSRTLIQSN